MFAVAMPEGKTWILIGIAILTLVAIFSRIKNRRRGSLGVDLPEPTRRTDSRESMEEIFVKLQEFSRETLAKLDTKIRALNELLSRADAKIAELRDASRNAPPVPPAPDMPAGRPANPLHEKVFRLADSGAPLPEITEKTGLQRGEIELILGLRGKKA